VLGWITECRRLALFRLSRILKTRTAYRESGPGHRRFVDQCTAANTATGMPEAPRRRTLSIRRASDGFGVELTAADLLIDPISQTRAGESGSWFAIAPDEAKALATALAISPPTGMIAPAFRAFGIRAIAKCSLAQAPAIYS
jgi:hypothetical protein